MDKSSIELLPPCGMDCTHCSSYLNGQFGARGKYKSSCAGCRPRNKQCAFIIKKCDLLLNKKVDFCYECDSFPCELLTRIERNYKKNGYPNSFIQNNLRIKKIGPEAFLKEQEERFACPDCGGPMSIHDGICYGCGKQAPNKETL